MPDRRSLRILTYSRRYTTLESIVGQRFPDATDRVCRGRASSIMSRHSRAMLQVSDHQVISQGSRL